ncbi:Nuclear factor related to kappa-B-binding protein [Bienertia sinuspersici]
MAIEKNNVKAVSRFDSEYSVGSRSRESMSTDDDEFRRRNSIESEDDEEFDDADSGAGSDDFDLLELGETGSEFCQVGDQTCCIPFELYDLPDLHGILSLDVWNDCLTEEERFGLTKYLPDMDQDTFMLTLKELFEGGNFHFGSPITELYQMLKGGQCEPRVALYRQGLNFFQTHQHYHFLRRHHDSMVSSFLQMREAWQNYKGYSIEEKLRVLNIVKSQKSLMGERNEDMGSDPSERESDEALLSMRLKGRNVGKKTGHAHRYGASPTFDVNSGGRAVSVDVTKYGQQNPKGLLKVGGMKNTLPNLVSSSHHSRLYGNQGTGVHGSDLVASRGGKAVMHDFIKANGDDEQEVMYGMASKGHWNVMDGNVMARGGSVKSGKKREVFLDDEYDYESYVHPQQSSKGGLSAHGTNLNINQLSDIKVLTSKPSSARGLYDPARRARYVDSAYENQMRPTKGRASQTALKGNLASYSDAVEPYWIKSTQGETYLNDPAFDYEGRDVQTRKLKGSEYPDHRLKSLQPSQQLEERFYHPAKRAKLLPENMRGSSLRNGGSNMFPIKGDIMYHGGEETESDSSDQIEEGDINPLIMSKRTTHVRLENSCSSVSRADFVEKKMKQAKKGVKESALTIDRMLPDSSTMANFGKHMPRPEIETYSSKIRQKTNTNNLDSLQNLTTRAAEDSYYDSIRNPYIEGDRKSIYRLGRNGQVPAELAGSSPMSLNKVSPVERRQKGSVGNDFLIQSKNMRDYNMEEDGGSFEGNSMSRNLDSTLVGCTSSVKKKKKKRKEVSMEIDGLDGSDYLPSHQQLSELIPLKNWAKKRPETECGSPGVSTSEVPVLEVGMPGAEREVKPQKKTLPPITPTIHTGFSFSIIHLLSAVRMALITPSPDDGLVTGKHIGNTAAELENQNVKHECVNGSLEGGLGMNKRCPEKSNVPSLTVQEIVNRVRSDPGDPCILETQEPLLDLIRGVLKIFSSKTAPLGAKGWKPLICYEKSSKCWSWAGPAPQSSTDNEVPEEVISPDAWKISRKMLVKLVDSYANWLKSGQETLQQIGSLPPPPAELMQLNFDEKERFRDLRAQKSLTTITQSSDDVRDYFRKEEQLRYSVPDRAFSYTAADGKKSIVAPLRRCGGKPTSKARDHFMLKRDRPPHVTILCLVRDAAARLPGSIGTRADVCTLIRDSQYIVEDVTDSQVNQVVSGALDRLHYERDPCVQFDSERKLWVYLHRDREEEDFEDDGTSSTKKWKRQKKDASEQDDQVTVASHANTEPNGFDLSSDINVASTCLNSVKTADVLYDDTRQRTEDDQRLITSLKKLISTKYWKIICSAKRTPRMKDWMMERRNDIYGLDL